MPGRACVFVSLRSAGADALAALEALPPAVTTVGLRADLAGDVDPVRIRHHGGRRLPYSLRSAKHGGASCEPDSARHQRLLATARWDGASILGEILQESRSC